MTITVDKTIISQQRQQQPHQRSKRQRSVHIRPQDPPGSRPPSISPLPTREEEQQHSPDEDDGAHGLLSSSLVCSKKEHCPSESVDCVPSSLRQSNASKRHWLFMRKNTTTSSTPPTNNQEKVLQEEQVIIKSDNAKEDYRPQNNDLLAFPQHPLLPPCTFDSSILHDQETPSPTHHDYHTTATNLFRRQAAVPSQLLKWAFDASMSLYDHLGDDDDEEREDDDRNSVLSRRGGKGRRRIVGDSVEQACIL